MRTSLLPYERNESGIVNLPLYLLFLLQDELKSGS